MRGLRSGLVLAGVALIATCYGLARFAYGLFAPKLVQEFSLSSGLAGLIGGGSYVGYCVAIGLSTTLTMRWGPRPVAVLAGITATLGIAVVAAAQGPAALAVRLRGQDDQAVHVVGQETVQGRADRPALGVVEVRDVDGIARLARGAVDGLQAGGGPVLEALAHEDADGGGPAGHERPGGTVGTEAELVHGRQHAVARLGPEARMTVDHAGDGLVGDARPACHVPDIGGARGLGGPVTPPGGTDDRTRGLSGRRQWCHSG